MACPRVKLTFFITHTIKEKRIFKGIHIYPTNGIESMSEIFLLNKFTKQT